MKLLIIGGTIFLGQHLVEAALARGHEVTLFNRGNTIQSFSRRLRNYVAIGMGTWGRWRAGSGTP